MNLAHPVSPPAAIVPAGYTAASLARISIYHLHSLVAGPLTTWPDQLSRIAAIGFSHICLAPPFEPGASGDIFTHATFDRLHPALGFNGPAEQGIAMIVDMAARCGMGIMLDIAPGQMAVDAPVRQRRPDWFHPTAVTGNVDPRRKPSRLNAVIPRFDQTVPTDAVCKWWQEQLSVLVRAGVTGFRCLTLDLVPPSVWRRLATAFPDALFMAWAEGIEPARLASLSDAGFALTAAAIRQPVIPAAIDHIDMLGRLAPVILSPEPSFTNRLASRLSADTEMVGAYRFILQASATLGSGLFIPMGFEHATTRRFDPVVVGPADWAAVQRDGIADLSDEIRSAIALNTSLSPVGALRPLTTPGTRMAALLRADTADVRGARHANLLLMNTDLVRPAEPSVALAPLPPFAGATFEAHADTDTQLRPGEVRVLSCSRVDAIQGGSRLTLSRAWAEATRIAIENVEPVVKGGEYAAKTVVGRSLVISADIFSDGHDILAASLLWRPADGADWQRITMHKVDNDRWQASVRPGAIGLYLFAIEAWWDHWASFTHDLHAKMQAGQTVALEVVEGRDLVRAANNRSASLAAWLNADADELLSSELAALMREADARPFAARSAEHRVRVDRPAAEFASWYELFPRSVTNDKATHGTFRSVVGRMPEIQAMGFDVLYFPPIHPIGAINRKGRNNSLKAAPGDVGSPYAIGGVDGGHDATHPRLGTLDDFRAMLRAAHRHGMEIAIDFAIQCAPDHPWVTQHRDWFRWRPDGSMRYAENPPKKYEDIVNPDFYSEASFPDVWHALRDVIQFWVDQGVRIFRVDNPHTKPLPFWQWMIADIQDRHPDVLFLAEAFTRPKLMYRLGKAGFSQSYTYFTWRNTKAELIEYLTELTAPPVSDFYRPNFFVNTPDINPVYLQTSGRPGFLVRAVLAATLSGLWGVYSGFEICESTPLPGREEYLDSEKYEIRPRDYAAPGNIVGEITALNRLRRLYPALQTHLGLQFYPAYNDQVILYGKRDPDTSGMVLVAVNLDPHNVQEATIELPLWSLGLHDQASIEVHDLMREIRFTWHGKYQRIRLDPADLPFAIWHLA